MCNFSQFLIPGFSINSTLTLLPRKLVGVSGELITSFQTKRSPHSVFPTRFLWATKAIPCSSPESPQSVKPEPLLIPGISHFLLQTICQPSGGNPVVTAAGVGRKNEVTSPCRRQSQLYPEAAGKTQPSKLNRLFFQPLTSVFSSRWLQVSFPLPTSSSFGKCEGP